MFNEVNVEGFDQILNSHGLVVFAVGRVLLKELPFNLILLRDGGTWLIGPKVHPHVAEFKGIGQIVEISYQIQVLFDEIHLG